MKFKLEMEAEPHPDGQHCGDCHHLIDDPDGDDPWCHAYRVYVLDNERGLNCLGDEQRYRRRFTCNHCGAVATCPHAWDGYNVGGDCLAEK